MIVELDQARLHAMRLAIDYTANDMMPGNFQEVMTKARIIHRFLIGDDNNQTGEGSHPGYRRGQGS